MLRLSVCSSLCLLGSRSTCTEGYDMAEDCSLTESELYAQLESKIDVGNNLIAKLTPMMHIQGMDKLKRKIHQEVSFLTKIFQDKTAKEQHVNCTNIHHFEAVVDCVLECTSINSVLESFYCKKTNKKIVVDIISKNGEKWIKVIAKNPKALTELSNGNGRFGKRNVLDQAKEYSFTAQQYMCMYRHPEVIFHFAAGIESTLSNQLESMGITVSGSVIDVSSDDLESASDYDTEPLRTTTISENNNGDTNEMRTNILNLDVTTMLAYVSSLTNTDRVLAANYVYTQPILQQQAELEKHQPVKPILDELFQGKELVCCESAATSFAFIVETIGGPDEKARAKLFMERVRVVADNPSLPGNLVLKTCGQISERSLIVFSTGHNLKAITVSANESFIRSAKSQGVEFAKFTHPARALTEKKMILLTEHQPKTDGAQQSELL